MQPRCWLSEGTHRTRSRSYEGPEIASPNIAAARQPVVNGGSAVVLSVMYTNQKTDLMTCGQYLNAGLITRSNSTGSLQAAVARCVILHLGTRNAPCCSH